MNIDDNIPEDDATATAARHALNRLGGVQPVDLSWDEVQSRARRVKQRRLSAIGAACAVVVIAAAVSVAALGSNGGDQVDIAGGVQPTTSESTTTTSTPGIMNSSSAATTFPGDNTAAPPPASGNPIVLPNLPSNSPLPGDFSGSITVNSAAETQPPEAGIGEPLSIGATVVNTSGREVWASSSLVPTALATVCSSDAAGSGKSLWWMTNVLLAAGDNDSRNGQFAPTDTYAGTVTCEVVIVTTNQQGTVFDQSAGGDAATATILGRVSGVPPVTFGVYVPSTTSVPNTDSTVPETTTTLTAP